MPKVQAVLFDYGLVLSGPPDPATWERLKHIVNANEALFYDAYWKHRNDYDRGSLTADAYWRKVSADVNHTLDEPQLQMLIDNDTDVWTQPNQPMIDWAITLQHAGVKTGILSNIGDAMDKGVLARCTWIAGFTHLTFSHRLKMAKPELAIYRYAAEGLNTAPAEILFIDDREDNIAAARIVGMQAVQYTTHEAFLRTMKSEGFESLLNL
jgi:putative hydrolase of the HAD superfamily